MLWRHPLGNNSGKLSILGCQCAIITFFHGCTPTLDHSELGIKVFQMLPLHDRLRFNPKPKEIQLEANLPVLVDALLIQHSARHRYVAWLSAAIICSLHLHRPGLAQQPGLLQVLPSLQKSSQPTGIHGKSMYVDVLHRCIYGYCIYELRTKLLVWGKCHHQMWGVPYRLSGFGMFMYFTSSIVKTFLY